MGNESAPPSPVERIKQDTRPHHERVERVLGTRFFSGEKFTRENYLELLEGYYGLYRPLDARLISAVETHFQEYTYSPRSDRLESDLMTLGLSERRLTELPLLSSSRLPPLDEQAEVLGCLYVIEGSEKGNAVIRETLGDALDEETLRADAYFGRAAEKTKRTWRTFQELFNRRTRGETSYQRALVAARRTFRMYREWFS